jgi:hypothetical protein
MASFSVVKTPGGGFWVSETDVAGLAATAVMTGAAQATGSAGLAIKLARGRMRRVRIRRGPWGVSRVEPLEPVRCALLDGSPEFPAGSARLDSVLVADDIPYHWFPLEMEDANGTWRPGRMTMITRHRDPGPAGGA